MEHIERMKKELEELELKIQKANDFLNKEFENPEFTDEIQRSNLFCQIQYMIDYSICLENRKDYDTEKANSEKSCSTSSNYDEVVEECFK